MGNIKNIIEKALYSFIILFPFMGMYILLLFISMESARDRFEYIKIMENPFSGREEIGISIFSYIAGFFLDDPVLKLLFFQIICICLVFFTIILQSNNNVLLRFLLCILACLSLFSVIFGTQLRVGFATVLLVFISLGLNKDAKISNLFWYLIPCFFHLAVIPAVILLYFYYYIDIVRIKVFLLFYLSLFFIILLGSLFLEEIILFFGLNSYYLDYLREDGLYEMRFLPFSFIVYLLVLFLLFFNIKKFILNYKFWMLPSGILFSLIALMLSLPFYHKFMGVFFFYTLIYLILTLNFSKKNENILLVFIYFLIPFGFFYFAKSVFLI